MVEEILDKPGEVNMNAQRRKQLRKIVGLLSEARGLLDEVSSAEREAYDNLPPSIRESERGERMDGIAGDLENAMADLETLESTLEEVEG